jgi:hypothetical protein
LSGFPIPKIPWEFPLLRALFPKIFPQRESEVRTLEASVDDVSAAILEHCLDGNKLAKLCNRYPQSSLYRKVGKLVARGLIVKEGDLYRTTDEGRDAFRPATVDSGLDRLFPPLASAPTAVHRAVLELILCAAVARSNGKHDDHHPAFVLLGPTLRWKTWTAKMICYMFGLDPVDHVLLAHAESGRSLLTRHGFAGTTVSKRGILSAPFVAIDEFHKADEATRRMARVYMQGTRIIAHENERLEIRPVPLFAMNPLKGDTLQERTGLDDALLRRCIVVDLEGTAIPDDLRSMGENILAEAQKAKPLSLLDRQPSDCAAVRPAITDTLRGELHPDAADHVDEELVLQLVEGMGAFMPVETAWAVVVRDLFTVWGTLGWVKPGWRLRLGRRTTGHVAPAPDGSSREPRTRTLREETLAVVAQASQFPRDYGLEKHLVKKQQELDKTRVAIDRAKQDLTQLHRQAKTTPGRIQEFIEARDVLKSHGLTWNTPRLLRAVQLVAKAGEHADDVIELAQKLVARGILSGDVDTLSTNLPEWITLDEAMRWLGSTIKRYGDLQTAIAAKEEEKRRASESATKLKNLEKQFLAEANAAIHQRNLARAEVAELGEECRRKKEQCANLEAAKTALEGDCANLSDQREQMRADVERSEKDLQSMKMTLVGQQHLAVLYAALETGLEGDGEKTQEVLRELGMDKGDNPVRTLRGLVCKTLGEMVVPRDAVDAERREQQSHQDSLREQLNAATTEAEGLRKALAQEHDSGEHVEAELSLSRTEGAESKQREEVLAEEKRSTESRLRETEEHLESERKEAEGRLNSERTAREAAETKAGKMEKEIAASRAETKKAESELDRTRMKVEAAERILPLARGGQPITLENMDSRIESVYRAGIEKAAAKETERRLAQAIAARGLVTLSQVKIQKKCAYGHSFEARLSPSEIEKLRSGEKSGRVLTIRWTPGSGYINCPTCSIRVTITMSEVLKHLSAAT